MRWTDAIRLSLYSYVAQDFLSIWIREWKQFVVVRPFSTDLAVLHKILIDREYAPPPGLSPTVIIDAGAYIGLSTMFFHHRFPEATIFALEPDPENFKLLKKNTSGVTQIQIINAALWSTNEPQNFKTEAAEPWASRISDQRNSDDELVQCITLTELENLAGGCIDLMKLDIEGGEAEVFKSVTPKSLARVKAIVIEFHDRFFPGSSAPFLKAIESLPHESYTQGENTWFVFGRVN